MNVSDFKHTVLVTGGSGDIGRAVVKKFHENYYNVAVHCSSGYKEAEDLCGELNAKGGGNVAKAFRADFRDPSSILEMAERISSEMGPAGILVNNAGLSITKLITDTSFDEWRGIFSVNTDAMFLLSKALLPEMIRQKFGKIVNISSIWGICGASCEVAYSASKAAVIGFTKALAKEAGPSGINVNCVAPGVIDTKMNSRLSADDLKSLSEDTPLGRLGTPEEIAEAVFFLCSDKASFITGQVLSPNGGFVI